MSGRPHIAHTRAQAKVNLGLRILDRGDDGYHRLETVFHQLELADEVRVSRTGGERALVCSGRLPPGGLGPARDNLAWRAAAAYGEAAGWSGGFHIELEKRIPTGGGLGGGSADAGAVLRACERLADRPLGTARLHAIAATLGSDVPFVAGEDAAAIGTGRGDRLTPVPALPPRAVALVFPRFAVPTRDAYGWLAADREGGGSAITPRQTAAAGGASAAGGHAVDWARLEAMATNDFEPVVGARHPEIGALVMALRAAGASIAMLSGSGSTVFGVFDEARAAAARATLADLPGDVEVVWTRTARRVVPVEVSG